MAVAPDIQVDVLTHPAVMGLLEQHRRSRFSYSPPDSVHALDLEGLRAPEMTLWSTREGDALPGCGALKEIDAAHGEQVRRQPGSSHHGRLAISATGVVRALCWFLCRSQLPQPNDRRIPARAGRVWHLTVDLVAALFHFGSEPFVGLGAVAGGVCPS